MAETLTSKRWSARILAVAMLVSVAIVPRAAASGSGARAGSTLERQSVWVQPAHAVVHHVQSKSRGDVVRSGGPLPPRPFVASAMADERSHEYSGPGVASDDAAAVTGYDATAPPQHLLT